MISTLQAQEMAATLATLDANYAQAVTVVGGINSLFDFIGAKASGEQALYVARRNIESLKGELRSQVLAGTRGYDSWKDVAQAAQNNLRTVIGTLPALSFSSIVSAGVADFKNEAAEALPWLAGGTGVVVVGLVALVAFIWRPRW